jgi:hypothetical protein
VTQPPKGCRKASTSQRCPNERALDCFVLFLPAELRVLKVSMLEVASGKDTG